MGLVSRRTRPGRAGALPLRNLPSRRRSPYHGAMASNAAPRFRINTSVAAVTRVHGHQRRLTGTTRDISSTGVFFYVDFRPEEGERLQLILTLPEEVTHADSIPAVCNTRVVRVEPGGTGDQYGVAVEIESWEPLAAA